MGLGNHSFTTTIKIIDSGNDIDRSKSYEVRVYWEYDIHAVFTYYILITKAKDFFTTKQFGDATLTKWSNLFPVIGKIGTMCPHDMTHVLPKMFSLNQSVLENIRQIHIEGHLAKVVWTLQTCLYQERQKWGVGGRPLEIKGNWRRPDSQRQCMVFDWILVWEKIIAIKEKGGNLSMDCILYDSIVSMLNFLTANWVGVL